MGKICYVTEISVSDLRRRGWISVGKNDYAFDDVHSWHFDDDDNPTIASSVGLVDEDGAGYCTLELDEDGFIESFSYDFDDEGHFGGDDIEFANNEIIRIT